MCIKKEKPTVQLWGHFYTLEVKNLRSNLFRWKHNQSEKQTRDRSKQNLVNACGCDQLVHVWNCQQIKERKKSKTWHKIMSSRKQAFREEMTFENGRGSKGILKGWLNGKGCILLIQRTRVQCPTCTQTHTGIHMDMK